jgi:mRNA interferase RelE/StbE
MGRSEEKNLSESGIQIMDYKLVVHNKALKEIQRLSPINIKRVQHKIERLKTNPRPPGHKKMEGYISNRTTEQECYRIRIGDIRVIYTIEDQIITITVLQVSKRGDIY